MTSLRLLVGTKKGAFILNSDGKRATGKWSVSGPHFAGWEIYHMKGSPMDPNRIYCSQTSGWFGQIIQRSNDGGKTWEQPGTPPGEPTTTPEGTPKAESNKFVYDTSPGGGKPMTSKYKRRTMIRASATGAGLIPSFNRRARMKRSTGLTSLPVGNSPGLIG